jgi:hypothetical protein
VEFLTTPDHGVLFGGVGGVEAAVVGVRIEGHLGLPGGEEVGDRDDDAMGRRLRVDSPKRLSSVAARSNEVRVRSQVASTLSMTKPGQGVAASMRSAVPQDGVVATLSWDVLRQG